MYLEKKKYTVIASEKDNVYTYILYIWYRDFFNIVTTLIVENSLPECYGFAINILNLHVWGKKKKDSNSF